MLVSVRTRVVCAGIELGKQFEKLNFILDTTLKVQPGTVLPPELKEVKETPEELEKSDGKLRLI
jgi:hypothetical protein